MKCWACNLVRRVPQHRDRSSIYFAVRGVRGLPGLFRKVVCRGILLPISDCPRCLFPLTSGTGPTATALLSQLFTPSIPSTLLVVLDADMRLACWCSICPFTECAVPGLMLPFPPLPFLREPDGERMCGLCIEDLRRSCLVGAGTIAVLTGRAYVEVVI